MSQATEEQIAAALATWPKDFEVHNLPLDMKRAIDAALSREAQSRDEVVELREALKPFVGDKTFELLLWGDMPDSATGSVSVQLGDFRRARAALSKSKQNP